jgi:hypothetical protein
MVQVPVLHEAAALAKAQGTPQSLQLVRLVTLSSQPLSGSSSQLWKPAAHPGVHSKFPGVPLHATVPCVLLQALPQLAQLEGVPSCVSQPGALVQSA